MVRVPDLASTLGWYRAIGAQVERVHEADGAPDWALLAFGEARLMLAGHGAGAPPVDLSLWLAADRLDELYLALRRRPGVVFAADLHRTSHGTRQFAIRDPNGLELVFFAPA
jgi:hypothetical protein